MDRSKLKIGVYVLTKYAKQTYAKECYDVRINAGMAVVCDILRRAGFTNIEYCSSYTAHRYDMVMYSVTSDCDWWEFVAERTKWEPGRYKVVVGGAGVLNPRPFLPLVDYFVLGRAENVQPLIAECIMNGEDCINPHVVSSASYSIDKLYYINQAEQPYPHIINLPNGKTYHESGFGCNHKCLFCGYTWHRKHSDNGTFEYGDLWTHNRDVELAMIDMHNGRDVNLNALRTTAIDGMSERIRFSMNKHITRDMLREFLTRLAHCEKPHQVKFYNIIGYPTETYDDWHEFLEDIRTVDGGMPKQDKQTSILLHSTPFRAMPATPLACKPMSYINYRGLVAKILGEGKYKGNIFYQGNAMWAVESMATESLPTVIQSAIIWRGTEADTDNIIKLAMSKKFNAASSDVKQCTLENYFDVAALFGSYTSETLPTRNIRTYCRVEKMWDTAND